MMMMMKTAFFLMGLLAVTYALWTPTSKHCNCVGSGTADIRTFDGALKSIVDNQKTLISQWGFKGDTDPERNVNPCRFILRMVTSWDILGEYGDLYLDWAGFSFDVPKTNFKPLRNLIFGQCDNAILERGKGFKGTILKQLVPSTYVYYRPGVVLYVFKDYTGMLKLRSDTCQYAFNWKANGRDTAFSFWLGNDYKDGSLLGMCGNCDGDVQNDLVRCDDQPLTSDVSSVNATAEISASCADGKNQNKNTQGSSKLNCLVDDSSQ